MPLTWNWDLSHHPMADQLNAHIQARLTAELPEGTVPHEPYAYAAALFYYQSGSGYSQLTRRLKYRADFPTGRYAARMLGERLAASPLYGKMGGADLPVDAVVPVPLHWMRRLQRGYNQAAVIAREVARTLGAPCAERLLRRRRRTRSQTRLSGEDKARNVAGAFALRKAAGVPAARRISLKHSSSIST
jgi:predicted amidophosphoribosyltransferase